MQGHKFDPFSRNYWRKWNESSFHYILYDFKIKKHNIRWIQIVSWSCQWAKFQRPKYLDKFGQNGRDFVQGNHIQTDFHLYINLWFYEDEFGWHSYEGKMKDGSDNYIEVQIKPRLTSNQTPIDTTLIHIQFFKWFPFSVYLIVFLSGMICDVETKNMSSGLYTFTTEFQENSNHSCEVLTLIH